MFLEGLQADLTTQPVDPACPKLGQYLMASMGSLPDEVLRILFLDASYRLIADEQLHPGSVRQLELYRSEEHTSELQSLMRTPYAVICMKNKQLKYQKQYQTTTQQIIIPTSSTDTR